MISSPTDLPKATGAPAALDIRGLDVEFPGPRGPRHAVRGVDLTLRRGEVLGLVGESGSGKSTVALAAMGLLPGSTRVAGSVRLDGTELVGAGDAALSRLRGRRIGMVFQDPLSALTPVHRVGDQIAEALRTHQDLSREKAARRAVELLDLVGIPDPRARAAAYPHQFSGGMRQRALIAMAIANDPEVILADEPTTALDVTVQAQVLDVLRTAQRETGAALLLVSHDLGVIAGMADRVAVMYAGRVVESAPAQELFDAPRMPYTAGLLAAVPSIEAVPGRTRLVPVPGTPPDADGLPSGCAFAPRCPLADDACRTAEPALLAVGAGSDHTVACFKEPHRAERALPAAETYEPPAAEGRDHLPHVLRVRGLTKTFPVRGGTVFRRRTGSVYAVDGVDLDIRSGETLGLVGESGSGKTTTLLEILSGTAPEGGHVELLGQDVRTLDRAGRRGLRGAVQIVFQDPMSSLDPRMPVGELVAEPLRAQRVAKDTIAARVPEVLELVGLSAGDAERYPHQFSGGQRQRIGIARALAVRPRLLVLDEPVSALDVSVQAGVLNLLADLRDELGLSYLFVSHDLSVVRHVADRVSVMYLGRTVEHGPAGSVFGAPRHPYTRALLSAVPVPDPARERARERVLLPGDPPSPAERVTGCGFRGRCPLFATLGPDQQARCETQAPSLTAHGPGHTSACHFAV
ncbi:oligopeptide ABC transporter ATP-binding protein OppF [Streptomyces chrestomyceticus JCM 4735]|uniref:Oligopeptide ABC transporter ATP-binding protein OppF n=1 Tax=Streptomyces chrestomyceticus JCM 4735 TaxID=1306181 RepID=A0A7U9PW34_9ACTN|nr:ABC transporter ATP-binding protein [Streptomyces chrestomyceticus]GCD33803.1 oligopeptide ABC transporter ATP-binding protein OppF [Streptomyces chrestomyceticus JCM 4735]